MRFSPSSSFRFPLKRRTENMLTVLLIGHLFLDKSDDRQIRREPVNAVKILCVEPACSLMFFKDRCSLHNCAPKALHTEMKIWVVILDDSETIPNLNLSFQFFFYFAYKCLLSSFSDNSENLLARMNSSILTKKPVNLTWAPVFVCSSFLWTKH